ncbi:MAG: ATP-binding cassette domain-containing protein [Ilumatobacteraceae bacterium]
MAVDRLVRTYGPVRALDGMTFSVPPGSVTGFLGPNGAGKTTTMRAIFGLTALDAGEVLWDRRPITQDTRHTFGYLPEERGLYPTMKVLEQLRYLGQLRGLTRAAADQEATRWLGELGLADRAGDELEDLSLGNQQRVQLIGALIHRPDVLVLDEPFSGLDPVAVDALSKVLVGEARRGATVLFSSHQLDLVEDLCERAVVVDRGRVVAEGTIDDLTAGSDPVLEIDVPSDPDGTWATGLGDSVQVIGNSGGRIRLTLGSRGEPGPGSTIELAQHALDAARAAGPVNHFAFERRSLAEVFLTTVGRPVHDDPGADRDPEDAERDPEPEPK